MRTEVRFTTKAFCLERPTSRARSLRLFDRRLYILACIPCLLLAMVACSRTSIVRDGEQQVRIVSRTFPRTPQSLHDLLLERYAAARTSAPEMFRVLAISQPPRGFGSDWLAT